MRWVSRVLLVALLLAALPSGPASSGAAAAPEEILSGAQAEARRRVLGYHVTYATTSWASLEANVGSLDDVAAQWVSVDPCGQIGSRDDQTLKQFAQSRGIRVFPSLLTGSGWLNNRLLTDEASTARLVGGIAEYVVAEGYEGFDIDLENIRPDDRAAYTAFVARLAAALHERGKLLHIAVTAKAAETRTGWAAAYDYAALGQHADLITLMAYPYSGAFSGPGSISPYDWVDGVLAFATSRIPPEKVLLGLAFYGEEWNTTSGGSRSLSYGQADALARHHGVPMALDPATRSATFRYRATPENRPALLELPPEPQHEITVREAPPCAVTPPDPGPPPAPRPAPPPGAVQEHVVWLEESAAAAARLGLADRYRIGGVAMWRLGLEDPLAWPALGQWRAARP